jgi:hypothetical protein
MKIEDLYFLNTRNDVKVAYQLKKGEKFSYIPNDIQFYIVEDTPEIIVLNDPDCIAGAPLVAPKALVRYES